MKRGHRNMTAFILILIFAAIISVVLRGMRDAIEETQTVVRGTIIAIDKRFVVINDSVSGKTGTLRREQIPPNAKVGDGVVVIRRNK